ncbi:MULTISPECIES: hypothetical protein [unclassified Streptomyces]
MTDHQGDAVGWTMVGAKMELCPRHRTAQSPHRLLPVMLLM